MSYEITLLLLKIFFVHTGPILAAMCVLIALEQRFEKVLYRPIFVRSGVKK